MRNPISLVSPSVLVAPNLPPALIGAVWRDFAENCLWRHSQLGYWWGTMTKAQSLALVRTVHTMIYIVMANSIFALLYAGVSGASGPWLWFALVMAAVEVVIFAGSGMKCPLTAVATRHGAKPGHDTFFPEAITWHTLAFFGPLLAISLLLLVVRWSGLLP